MAGAGAGRPGTGRFPRGARGAGCGARVDPTANDWRGRDWLKDVEGGCVGNPMNFKHFAWPVLRRISGHWPVA